MDTDLVRDFIDRYEQGDPTQGYSEREALSAFEQAAEIAPPEVLRQASDHAIDRLDPEQRAEFDELMRQNLPQEADDGMPLSFGLETLLSGLFGGSSQRELEGDARQRRSDQREAAPPNLLETVGPLLASPVGRAVIGGIGAFALKAMTRGRG